MLFGRSAGIYDASGDRVIAGTQGFEVVREGAFGGGVDELSVVAQFDFDGLLVRSGGVDGHGDIGGCFDFCQMER